MLNVRHHNRRGLWIALFGPDGAGKTATIDELTHRLKPLFSEVTGFHFRPEFGNRTTGRPPVLNPHGQAPRSRVISLVKLIYWLLDCWLGYLTVILPALRRAQIVIFDRYLPDILVDPQRYRLPASAMWLARFMVRLAPCPDLYILLDVSAEELQRRKCEVAPAESQRQRTAYFALFRSLAATLVIDAERPVPEVACQVMNALSTLHVISPLPQSEASAIANL